MPRSTRPRALLLLLPMLLGACAGSPTALDEAIGETGIEGPFDEVPGGDGKYDENGAARGPKVSPGSATEVWAVTRAWADVDAAAGLAWEPDSGLDWEQKFDLWVSSFGLEPRFEGSGDTFVMTTPYGDRSFHAPTLECAEVAIFLRATFASWYGLPFYLEGWSSETRSSLYAGHFGFVDSNGDRAGRFPRFHTKYRDYEDSWEPGQPWPSDPVLRRRRLGDDDEMPFLAIGNETVGAGAYFDEVYLNKRVGYFMRLVLLYFGSTNLADGANMFHIVPESIVAGDILLKRWQRRGIGDTKPIFRVERLSDDALQASVASGSMPRREPVWAGPSVARSSFVSDRAGGVGESFDGEPYATLGGGARRWRSAAYRNGRWYNDVMGRDREVFIADSDVEAISARPARFDEILRTLSAEEKRDTALAMIEAAREHLRSYPASCAARTSREDAFDALYEVMVEEQGSTRAQVDAEFRTLEDYVFAELEYTESRTCCWNRSTSAMYEIIMDYADVEEASATEAGMCASPTVFRAETDGYARWRDHAISRERGAEWREWSEDESCEQRNVPEDTIATGRDIVDYCATPEIPAPPAAGACEPEGGDDDASTATLLTMEIMSEICAGDVADWYRIEGDATVVVTFAGDEGDLDVEAVDEAGEVIELSNGTADEERVSGTGTFFVRVYGYAGALNQYRIAIEG